MSSVLGLCVVSACAIRGAIAADEPDLTIHRPRPFQVIQRQGFLPRRAHVNEAGGPRLGIGDVALEGESPAASQAGVLEWRVQPCAAGPGPISEWTKCEESTIRGGRFTAVARVPAGGWYRLEMRLRSNDAIVAKSAVEPIGVGEVFVVAGQSYATNCNDERLTVQDSARRISAFDTAKLEWRIADDPQPAPDESDGGSIWPHLGDLLLPPLRVPVGFVNVAWGGTSSEQWLPGGQLHNRLSAVVKQVGRFRCVLWQQGESDVIARTSSDQYVQNLQAIRQAAEKEWSFSPTWLLAKSTLHPTVYRDPQGEERIRVGIDRLTLLPGFGPGPDTDVLGGEFRGPVKSRRHFSPSGQRRAAELWFAVIWSELSK